MYLGIIYNYPVELNFWSLGIVKKKKKIDFIHIYNSNKGRIQVADTALTGLVQYSMYQALN